jgi:hypothetical protein
MRKSQTGVWMGIAFLVALALAGLTLEVAGAGTHGTTAALKVTARWSYCLFLPAYAGGALARLFGSTFQPVASRARQLGLAFATAHLVHIALVVWLYYISPRPPLHESSAVFFSVALVFTYVLALFSIARFASLLPPMLWRLLRTVGMEYIALAFLLDFLQDPFGHGLVNLAAYLPFAAVGCAAALLRILAYAKRLLRGVYPPPPLTAIPPARARQPR